MWARSSDRRFHQRPRRWDVNLQENTPGCFGQSAGQAPIAVAIIHGLLIQSNKRKHMLSDNTKLSDSQLACCFLPSTWASPLPEETTVNRRSIRTLRLCGDLGQDSSS